MALTSCPIDGKPVDPDTDHAGRPHGGARRLYCSVDCRIDAELERRRAKRAAATAVREHARAKAAALELERREPPLPGMPAPPILTAPVPALTAAPA